MAQGFRAIAQCFRHMHPAHGLDAVEIGNGAGDLHGAVKAAGRQVERIGGLTSRATPDSSWIAMVSSTWRLQSALVRTPFSPSAAKRARCRSRAATLARTSALPSFGATRRDRRPRPPALRSADRCDQQRLLYARLIVGGAARAALAALPRRSPAAFARVHGGDELDARGYAVARRN